MHINLKKLISKIEEQNERVRDYKIQSERCQLVHANKQEQVIQRVPKNKVRKLC